jgi:hypothetical protein
MNPRHRRLLIPGLLTVLIVVVLLTSLARSAKGATVAPGAAGQVVSTIGDPRIAESSGLILSMDHTDLAYTVNDSGNAPIVFAIRVSTGKTVGATTIRGGTLVDTEALSIDSHGTLWIADTGDNAGRRTDSALYSLPEPGEGSHTVTATRYPVSYADRPHNVEALLINPVTGAKFLASKGAPGGKFFELPTSLSTSSPNIAKLTATIVPAVVTDGAFTPDGRHAVLRTYGSMSVYDASDWKLLRGVELPKQEQGETIAVEAAGDSVLIGSEGKNSQLVRVPLDTSAPTAAEEKTVESGGPDDGNDRPWVPVVVVAGVLVVAAGVVVARRLR